MANETEAELGYPAILEPLAVDYFDAIYSPLTAQKVPAGTVLKNPRDYEEEMFARLRDAIATELIGAPIQRREAELAFAAERIHDIHERRFPGQERYRWEAERLTGRVGLRVAEMIEERSQAPKIMPPSVWDGQ